MIHKISISLSFWCRKILDIKEEERQLVQYGIEVLLDGFIKIVILLAIGSVLGCPGEFGVSLLAFCSLRYWAGGIHCRTSAGCLGAMLSLCLVSTYGGKVVSVFTKMHFGWIVLLTYFILICFAPGMTRKSLDMSKEQAGRKRIGALIWITMEYGIVMAVENVHLKWCIVFAIVIEVLSIIPCRKEQKRRREKI